MTDKKTPQSNEPNSPDREAMVQVIRELKQLSERAYELTQAWDNDEITISPNFSVLSTLLFAPKIYHLFDKAITEIEITRLSDVAQWSHTQFVLKKEEIVKTSLFLNALSIQAVINPDEFNKAVKNLGFNENQLGQ